MEEQRYTIPPQRVWLAITLFCAGLTFGALHSALGKVLTADLSIALIIWGRYVGYLTLVLGLTLWR